MDIQLVGNLMSCLQCRTELTPNSLGELTYHHGYLVPLTHRWDGHPKVWTTRI